MPTVQPPYVLGSPAILKQATGKDLLFPSHLRAGKVYVHCNICSQEIFVGPNLSTHNLLTHRVASHGDAIADANRSMAGNASSAGGATTSRARSFTTPTAPYPSISTRLNTSTETPTPRSYYRDQNTSIPTTPSAPPLNSSRYAPTSPAMSASIDSDLSERLEDMMLDTDQPQSETPAASAPPNNASSGVACDGFCVKWEAENAWLTYSFHLHASLKDRLPWDLIGFSIDGTSLTVRAHSCTTILSSPFELQTGSCRQCQGVVNQRQFTKLMQSARDSEPERYKLNDLSREQLIAVVHQKSIQLRKERTKVWNKTRYIKRLQSKIDDYKRIMVLLSAKDVPGIRRVIATQLKQGRSPAHVYDTLERAVNGTYHARSGFNQRDYDKAFLAKALGGPRLLAALHRADGYPATSTVRKHRPVAQLRPSLGSPTKEEISENINSLLSPDVRAPPTRSKAGELPGIVVMIDGVALEEVCRYDCARDSVIGICREHGRKVDLKVDGVESLEKLSEALEKGICHHGKDGTVLAIAVVTDAEHYTPIPLLLSGSCKKETGKVLKEWLSLFMDVWHEHQYGEALYGPIQALASDGESSFRLARFELCVSEDITPDSDLGAIVCELPGFNCRTGKYRILGTCDYKHIFKRFATLLRSVSGILVDDTWITPSDIRDNLMTYGLTEEDADRLLDPTDKQNVPKAVRLLQTLAALPPLSPLSDPDTSKRRAAIDLIAETFGYFLRPFTDVDMNLEDQCKSLATYAHLIAAMYLKERLSFMTSALYADSQAIVKNIFVTIAKLKIKDPEMIYYIILDGTDRLEGLFSNVRTQDHNRNFDMLQLAQKLSIAAEISATYSRNPDLDPGHDRSNLSGAIGVDHINPKSCNGTYRVGDIDLKAVWAAGAAAANAMLERMFGRTARVDFPKVFAAYDVDVLRPTRTDGYVGTSYGDDKLSKADRAVSGEEDLEEEERLEEDDEEDDEIELGLANFEDFMELDEQLNGPSESSAVSPFLEVPDDSGSSAKKYHKSSLIRVMLGGQKSRRKVAMRTLRARGLTMDDLRKRTSTDDIDEDTDEDVMKKGDIGGVLVRIGSGAETTVCLAVISIVGFAHNGIRTLVSQVPRSTLEAGGEKCPNIVAQILQLDPMDLAPDGTPEYWLWTGDYARFMDADDTLSISTSKQYHFSFPGYAVHPLAASAVSTPNSSPISLAKTWRFSHKELTDTTRYAWSSLSPTDTPDELKVNLETVLRLPDSSTTRSHLPYSTSALTFFTIASQALPASALVQKHTSKDSLMCRLCNRTVLLPDMRGHVGKHILYRHRQWDPLNDGDGDPIGPNPCGWCGETNKTCSTRILPPEGKKKSPRIESTCEYHHTTMRYSSASQSLKTSPCSNVPLECPLCVLKSGEHRTIWKYNAWYHVLSEHSHVDDDDGVSLPQVPFEFFLATHISREEEENMGVDVRATSDFREVHGIPTSSELGMDDMEVDLESRKRALSSATDSGHVAKRS